MDYEGSAKSMEISPSFPSENLEENGTELRECCYCSFAHGSESVCHPASVLTSLPAFFTSHSP